MGVNVSGREFDFLEGFARENGLSVGAAARIAALGFVAGAKMRREDDPITRRANRLAAELSE